MPRAKRHKLINDLPDEKKSTIIELFRRGETVAYVITYIQDKWKLFPNTTPDTLRRHLMGFKRDLVKQQMIEALIDEKGDLIDAVSRLAKAVDVGNELAILYYTQRARCEKLLEGEMAMGSLLNPAATRELGVLKDILCEVKKLQLETGALKRAPIEGTIQPNEQGGLNFRFNSAAPALEAFLNDAESYVEVVATRDVRAIGPG